MLVLLVVVCHRSLVGPVAASIGVGLVAAVSSRLFVPRFVTTQSLKALIVVQIPHGAQCLCPVHWFDG